MTAFDSIEGSKKLGTFSRGIAGDGHLRHVLGAARIKYRPDAADAAALDGIVAWGRKPNTEAAERYCRAEGLPLWRLEDGFLRSVGLGVQGHPALSLVLDEVGMYYDATAPSALEQLLQAPESVDAPGSGSGGDTDTLSDPALLARARACIDSIVDNGLSKYNDAPTDDVVLPGLPGQAKVLVVDQTRGDMSLRFGNVAPDAFGQMVDAALREHPDAHIVVKTHPDVIAGKRQSALGGSARHDRVSLWAQPANPIATLKAVDHVYCATSLLGFEALLVGKPVSCFGAPFYAGWGLTSDVQRLSRRTRTRSVEQVFAAAYLLYARYFDPDSGQRCEIERVLDHLALQRSQFKRNAGSVVCLGFPRWKRAHLRPYLQSPGNDVIFARGPRHARQRARGVPTRVLVWGADCGEQTRELASSWAIAVEHVEDGFLRSVGLGSDFVAPSSLVFDRSGIYYDPSKSSDLEAMLESHVFTKGELARAGDLRSTLLRERVTKYNFRGVSALAAPTDGRRVVLVPGQVEDDASILLGCVTTRTNADLIAEARKRCPDAYLVYKPHPDVSSGNRRGRVPPELLERMVDRIESTATIDACLEVADEVHTMTSLVGFESLLRGIPVTVHGRPFYAGWGLTTDLCSMERRTRRLRLDELVAATLVCYPSYLNPETGQFTTVEATVSNILRTRTAQPIDVNAAGVRRWIRRAVRYGRSMLDVR